MSTAQGGTETLLYCCFCIWACSVFIFEHAWTILIVATYISAKESVPMKQWTRGLLLPFLNYWCFYAMRQHEVFRQERLFFPHFLKMAQWQCGD